MALEGIDVSAYQGMGIDWHRVRSVKRFAMIKATEGTGYADPAFPHNWPSARAAGLQRLAYHFLWPQFDGARQADYMHAWCRLNGHLWPGDGVVLDLEETSGLDTATVIRQAEAFVQRIKATTVAGIFVYTGAWFWEGVLGSPSSPILQRCPLIEAQYTPRPSPMAGWPSGAAMWQYSDTGSVPGVSAPVDLDRFFGTMAQLRGLCIKGGR